MLFDCKDQKWFWLSSGTDSEYQLLLAHCWVRIKPRNGLHMNILAYLSPFLYKYTIKFRGNAHQSTHYSAELVLIHLPFLPVL